MRNMVRSFSSPLPRPPPLMRDLEANQPLAADDVVVDVVVDNVADVVVFSAATIRKLCADGDGDGDGDDGEDAAVDGHAAFNLEAVQVKDFFNRAGWRQTFVLAMYEGLLSMAGLFIAYLQFIDNTKSLVIIWIAQLASTICTDVVMDLVKFYTEYYSKLAQIKREAGAGSITSDQLTELKSKFPSPWYYMGASVTGSAIGSSLPLLATLIFIDKYKLQLAVLVPVVCLAVAALGGWMAVIMKVPVVKSSTRFLFGGLSVMAIAYASNWFY